MSEILFHYQDIYPTTWAYVASLMIIGLFFKFNRFWSVRNLDLVLLILLAPGLLLVHFGNNIKKRAVWMAASESSLEVPTIEKVTSEEAIELSTGGESVKQNSSRDNLLASDSTSASDTVSSSLAEDKMTADKNRTIPSTPATRELFRGFQIERWGYIWVFAVGAVILVRLLIDPAMVRRPLLDPNLTLGGLTFIGFSLFVFLMASVITGETTEDDLQGARGAELLMSRQEADEDRGDLPRHGPGLPLLHVLPTIPTALVQNDDELPVALQSRFEVTAKLMAILSHLAIVLGIVFIGYRHFENTRAGMGAAILYLLLPYTALTTGRVIHVLPAALLVWAIVFYRRPTLSGVFLGMAMGVVYYPFFLLPLWISFYWQRGLWRLALGVVLSLAVVILSLAFTSSDVAHFSEQIRQNFGLWIPKMDGLEGFWSSVDRVYRVYRIPVLAAFIGICAAMALWPAQKNLGTLMSCSTTVMLACQFWHGYGGGTYVAWYLPLLLLTIFRPNLEDRIALTVLGGPRRTTEIPDGKVV